jgi:hypothetical protein
MGKAKAATKVAETAETPKPDRYSGRLRFAGGSVSDDFCNIVLNQAIAATWRKHSDADERNRLETMVIAAMSGMEPQDELEGMLVSQLVSVHNSAMERYRRAMISDQTFEGRRENLSQANKLSRTYAVLVEALDRHRGKGQQHVTVEHVHVHRGGQAIVGNVTPPGGGDANKFEEQAHAPSGITYEPGTPMRCPDPERQPVPVASGAGAEAL